MAITVTILEADIAVIGAGIAGVSLAAEIAESMDGRVVLLEQEEHPGYHATGRSAAILAHGYGTAVSRELTRLSLPYFQAEALQQRGILYVAILGADSGGSHLASAAADRLSGDKAAALSPVLNPDRIAFALFDPEAADIDVHAVQSEALRRFRSGGGRLVTGAGVRATRRLGELWRLDCGDLTVDARIVVNSAGAWAGQVASLFGAQPIRLTPNRRSAALVTLAGDVDLRGSPMVVDLEETVYFKPEVGGLMISPADETPSLPCDSRPEEIDIAIGVDRFEQISRFPVRRVTHTWAGLRTFANDRNPVLGFDAVAPGFFWLAGQGGVGIQTSPILARLGCDLLLDVTPRSAPAAELIAQLSPGRFIRSQPNVSTD